jgi:hypothetical protein
MAIFGDLKHFSFPDVLLLTSGHRGVLVLSGHRAGAPWRIHVEGDRVRAFVVNDEPLDDILTVRQHVKSLLRADRGTFRLEPPGDLRHDLDVTIEQLLKTSLDGVTLADVPAAHLPHEDSRFTLRSVTTVWLSDIELFLFLERGRRALQDGASARELADELHLPLAEIRLYLYKLRMLKGIAPVSAYAAKVTRTRTLGAGAVAAAADAAASRPRATGPAAASALPLAAEPAFAPAERRTLTSRLRRLFGARLPALWSTEAAR